MMLFWGVRLLKPCSADGRQRLRRTGLAVTLSRLWRHLTALRRARRYVEDAPASCAARPRKGSHSWRFRRT